VDLDVNQFFKAMESVLGRSKDEPGNEAGFDGKSSSSDIDLEDDSDYGSDFGEESGEKGMDNAFMESYSDALNKELSMTTIEKSFARAPHPDTSNEVILSHSIS
jgi:hypothetical protein